MAFGPVMAAGEITLRPAIPGDLGARRALGVDPEIVRMFGSTVPAGRVMGDEAATRWFSALGADGTVEWIVEHAGNFLGAARLHSFDDRERRARYAVGFFDRAKLGSGLGRIVTGLVLRYAFDALDLDTVELVVLDFNARAQRCYRACGFEEVGRFPSGVLDGERPADDVLMVVRAGAKSAASQF